MIGLILSSCLPKQSPPRLKDEVPLVALGLLDGEDAAVDPLPVRLQEELNEALATRNILPQWSGPEGAGSLRSTAARWEAALAGAEAAPLVLLAEVRARFDSLLEGRFRWTVSVTLTLGPRDRPAARSDRRFDVPVFLRFHHQGAEDALNEARGPVRRRLLALVDEVLEGAGLPLEEGFTGEAGSGSAPEVRGTGGASSTGGSGRSNATPPLEGPLYFVLVDRFVDRDATNNQGAALADPQAFHGGDLEGLTDRLDYLQELGVRTLWLSPLTRSGQRAVGATGPYHGYWVEDHRDIEPRFGDWDDLERLRDEAEKRGIALLLDWVANHVGYDSALRETHPGWFHGLGPISDWNDPKQVEEGEVHGLPDLAQEREPVYQYLLDAARTWVDRARPAGFRLDAVKHVPVAFWQRFARDLGSHAGSDFVLLGEIFDGLPRRLAQHQRDGSFTHVFDFPLYYALTDVFCRDASPMALGAVLSADVLYADPGSLVTFADNHDLPRLASSCAGDRGEMTQLLAFLFASRGTPCLTYGTEAGLSGESDPENRGDMRFGEDPGLFTALQQLAALRRGSEALAVGRTVLLLATEEQLVLLRIAETDWALAAVNRAGSSVDLVVRGRLPAGAQGAPAWSSSGAEAGTAPILRVRPGAVDLVLPERSFGLWIGEGVVRPEGVSPVADVVHRWRVEGPQNVPQGAELRVVGSLPALGAWDAEAGLPLAPRAGGLHEGRIALPAQSVVQYKLVLREEDGAMTWEEGPNRSLWVEGSEAESLEVRLQWGG